MNRINLALGKEGEAHLRYLRLHGHKNVSKLLRELLAEKVEKIKQGYDTDDVLSVNPRARLVDGNIIILHNCGIRATFVPLLRLIKKDVITKVGDDLYCKLQE